MCDKFDYSKLIISKNIIILKLYLISLREIIQILVYIKVNLIIFLKILHLELRNQQQKLVRIIMKNIIKLLKLDLLNFVLYMYSIWNKLDALYLYD